MPLNSSPSSSAGETTPPSWRFAEAGAVAGRSRADSATAPNNARSHPPNFGSNNMAPPLDTCHDCRGRAGSATTKTMVPQTQLERAAPKPRTRVRTGCTQCLKHGRRCYAHRHACAAGVSENWEINKDLETNAATAVQRLQSPGSIGAAWTGRNWRERYSLHFYADFITSSNGRADYSDFWRQGLLQTSFQEPAILHGLVAIGALYEKNLRAKSGGYEVAKYNKSITEFAMAQFDRAIQCIRMSSYNNPNQQDPRITLAVCLLSAHFLNLQGLVEEAIEHGRMTLGLLQACKRGASRSSCALPLDCLEPAVRRVYTLAMSGTKATRAAIIRAASTNTESAPHGEVLEVSISSLGDAEENLHQILCRIRAIKDKRSAPEPSDEIAQVYETLKIRLDMWEDEFSNFLTRDGAR
ncbi:hypothetical protein H2203_007570 [Taxawa tesnikishii (nom. ined.)]|nr:hypothetical protein H2203_007570 [Dothideales sp. JES 119]